MAKRNVIDLRTDNPIRPIPETDLLVEMPVVAGQPGAQHRAYAPQAYGQKTETETETET
jgi:hypothetical protein